MPFMNGNSKPQPILRVGIIGCGEIAQVAHIPTFNSLAERFRVTYLCDVSNKALEYSAQRVVGATPQTTTIAEHLTSSPDVDMVLVSNANAFHVPHAIPALRHNKHVLVEKPLALNYAELDRLVEAEKQSQGKVPAGHMRRYAPAFQGALNEVGPNKIHKADSESLQSSDKAMLEQMLVHEIEVEASDSSKRMLNLLGGKKILGSHDLSAMRELLGMPKAVPGAYLGFPFWNAILEYDDFSVVYESGINSVPIFDTHIEIYTNDKIVRVNYDTPYIKGLPVTMTIRENIGGSEGKDAIYQERQIRKTYEDPYTLEMCNCYDCVVNGKAIKTTALDAREDLDLFKMLMQAASKRQ